MPMPEIVRPPVAAKPVPPGTKLWLIMVTACVVNTASTKLGVILDSVSCTSKEALVDDVLGLQRLQQERRRVGDGKNLDVWQGGTPGFSTRQGQSSYHIMSIDTTQPIGKPSSP